MDAPGTGYEVTAPERRAPALPAAGRRPRRSGRPGWRSRTTWSLRDVIGRPDARGPAAGRQAAWARPPTWSPSTSTTTCRPAAELDRRLAAAGARAVPDGTTLTGRRVPRRARGAPAHTGARAGPGRASRWRRSSGWQTFPEVVYVATGGRREGDAEWAARVGRTASAGLASWRTEETCDLVAAAGGGRPAAADRLPVAVADGRDGPGRRVGRRTVGGRRRGGAARAGRRAGRARCAGPGGRWSR